MTNAAYLNQAMAQTNAHSSFFFYPRKPKGENYAAFFSTVYNEVSLLVFVILALKISNREALRRYFSKKRAKRKIIITTQVSCFYQLETRDNISVNASFLPLDDCCYVLEPISFKRSYKNRLNREDTATINHSSLFI